MKIKYDKPPFWSLIEKAKPGIDFNKIAVSFGDTVYCSRQIPAHMLIHEQVHVRQMRESNFIAVLFYICYSFSRKFRRKAEGEAYREQFQYIRNSISDKELLEEARKQLARHMSLKSVYGAYTKPLFTYDEAYELLK